MEMKRKIEWNNKKMSIRILLLGAEDENLFYIHTLFKPLENEIHKKCLHNGKRYSWHVASAVECAVYSACLIYSFGIQ